jgi:thiamine kinase-like enzyme
MNADIENIIARVPGWSKACKVQVERIGGLTNANYRVTVNGGQYALRVSRKNSAQLGVDREKERSALLAVAAAGLGPEVVAFLLPEGHLVTRWINGRHWEAAEFRTPDHVRLLTNTVKKVHALATNGAVFSPFRRVESHIKTARKYGAPFPSNFHAYLETMAAVETDQRKDTSDWRHFCHNDMVSVNYLFCDQDSTIKVLDWEFSGEGDIYYDLATVVYTHDNIGPIPPDLEEVMQECYFSEITNLQHRRLQGMKYMLMLFTGMWGLAQHGMQLAGLIPPVNGFDYREFSEYLFDHDIRTSRENYIRSS